MNLTTIIQSKRLKGNLRNFAKSYIRQEFIKFKASARSLDRLSTVKFVHKIGQQLNISDTVVKNLCEEGGVNLSYGTLKDASTRSWINTQIDNGICPATIFNELSIRGVLNSFGKTLTYKTVYQYIRRYKNLDVNHETSGNRSFVNHLARKAPKSSTYGIGAPDTNKPIEVTSHKYNMHIASIGRGLNISETQVKRMFAVDDIENKSPNYLISKTRETRATRKKRSRR